METLKRTAPFKCLTVTFALLLLAIGGSSVARADSGADTFTIISGLNVSRASSNNDTHHAARNRNAQYPREVDYGQRDFCAQERLRSHLGDRHIDRVGPPKFRRFWVPSPSKRSAAWWACCRPGPPHA